MRNANTLWGTSEDSQAARLSAQQTNSRLECQRPPRVSGSHMKILHSQEPERKGEASIGLWDHACSIGTKPEPVACHETHRPSTAVQSFHLRSLATLEVAQRQEISSKTFSLNSWKI